MNEEVSVLIKQIKSLFRTRMNGVVSHSMNQGGLNYKINWGIHLNELQSIANDYYPNLELATALWKENIRECKILGTMIAPHDTFPIEIAEIWMEQINNQELAEQIAFNLLQYQPYASILAYKWIASDNAYYKICGYNILSRLFMTGSKPDSRGINELIDQAIIAINDENVGVKHAAYNCMTKFSQLGDEYVSLVRTAIEII